MDIQTWETSLSTSVDNATLSDMRTWLQRQRQTVPSRDADVIAKYLRLAIAANNEWGGVPVPVIIRRPYLPSRPWDADYQGTFPHVPRSSRQPMRLGELAIGSFGLLCMLALFLAYAL